MPFKKYFVLIFAGLFLALSSGAEAAVVYILPGQGNFAPGETISIDVKIDSEGASVNAVQGEIGWPADVLEFIGASKDGSAFNFWLEEPALSGAKNSLSFIGGTAKGIAGGSLQVVNIKFKAATAGGADISITGAAVTANDGHGTNVLSNARGASLKVGAEAAQPKSPAEAPKTAPTPVVEPTAPPAEAPKTAPLPIPVPVRVERKAIPSQVLPQKPVIQVPQYPDQTQWHNYLGEVVALWDVSPDVIAVAAVLDHNPNTIPAQAEKELTTGRDFGAFEDGIWHVHARFKNNIGWSEAAHFRFAIDTKPPAPFELVVQDGETTDNPAPVIQFTSSDALSGLKGYEIRIDNNEAVKISAAEFAGQFTLPLQVPGTHRVEVKAIDEAGNSVADAATIEILPIPAPGHYLCSGTDFFGRRAGLEH